MSDWPLLGDGQVFEAAGPLTSASGGTVVTAAGSANTKGSYAQLVASTARDAAAIAVFIQDVNSVAGIDMLVDIAVGAAASEQVILSNLSAGRPNTFACAPYLFPIGIPAGSRLSARCQATTLSSTTRIHVVLMTTGFLPSSPLSRVTTYGDATADSGGVSIDPGGVAHTEGAWTEITSSTADPLSVLNVGVGHQTNTARTAGRAIFDIGVGAAGSEQVLIPDLSLNMASATLVPTSFGPYPVAVPAGTRIAVRAQSSVTDATDRLFDVILYGVC